MLSNLKGRSFKRYYREQYQSTVKSDPQWKTFWLTEDVNLKWSLAHKIIVQAADMFCPLVPMKFENDGWFTKNLIEVNGADPRSFWRKLNDILGNSKSSRNYNYL